MLEVRVGLPDPDLLVPSKSYFEGLGNTLGALGALAPALGL